MRGKGMTCTAVREAIQRMLDRDPEVLTLPTDVAAHLAACPSCRAFRADVERIALLMRRLPPATAPVGLITRVMEGLPDRRAGGRLAWWRQHAGQAWAPMVGAVGALVLLRQLAVQKGVSLLTLPRAVAEWAGLIDLGDPASLLGATSAFGQSVQSEFLIGVSLVLVAVSALLVQVLARPPIIIVGGSNS